MKSTRDYALNVGGLVSDKGHRDRDNGHYDTRNRVDRRILVQVEAYASSKWQWNFWSIFGDFLRERLIIAASALCGGHEGEVPIAASGLAAGLAEQHLDQIPMHAAVIFTQAIDERFDVELHVSMAGHAVDRKSRSGLQLFAERVLDEGVFHGHGNGELRLRGSPQREDYIPEIGTNAKG